MDELILKITSEDIEERQDVAYELGQTENPNAVPYLVKMLSDPDLYVRIYAIQGLRDIPDKSAVQPLCTILQSNLHQPLIVSNVCRALGEIRDSAAVPFLSKLLEHHESFVRYDAAFALGEIGDTDAIQSLEFLYNDKSMPSRKDEGGGAVHTIYSVGQQAKRAVEMIKGEI